VENARVDSDGTDRFVGGLPDFAFVGFGVPRPVLGSSFFREPAEFAAMGRQDFFSARSSFDGSHGHGATSGLVFH
jgi:hypothetical protein